MVGAGKLSAMKVNDLLKLGGAAAGKLLGGNAVVTIMAELPDGAMKPDQAAAVASGVRLRAYKFDRYKTRKKDGEDAAVGARHQPVVDGVRVGQGAPLGDPHRVDVTDQVTDAGVWGGQFLRVAFAAVPPGHRQVVPEFSR